MIRTKPAQFLFIAILLTSAIQCKKEDDMYSIGNPDAENLNNIIAFAGVSPVELVADSATVCTITIKIHPEASTGNRQVKFVTDGGTFANGDTMQIITANAEGIAVAHLLSDKPRKTNVRASVKDTYFIDTAINFLPSLPDDMLLSADIYSGDTSSVFQITNKLFRNPQRGKVSDPVKVMFYVTPLDTTVNLVYPAFSFSEDKTSVIELINPYKVTGRFNIVAKAPGAAGDSLSRSIRIEIKE